MNLLPQPTVCIDVRSTHLSVIVIRSSAVRNWASLAIPVDLATDAAPDAPGRAAQVLKAQLEDWSVRGGKARIGVPDEAVIMRTVQLPPMPARELRRAMDYTLEREMPFPPDRSCRTWGVINRHQSHYDVLLAFAWRDLIQRYLDLARLAGLEAELIEPRSLGVARALSDADAVVLEAARGRMHGLRIGILPAVGQSVVFEDTPAAVDAAIKEVLAVIAKRAAGRTHDRPPQVLVAGDLEALAGVPGFPGEPASAGLNGHPPRRPADFPAGHYLAPIGLAMGRAS